MNLELQSRFGDKPAKFQVSCPQLSPKGACGSVIITNPPEDLKKKKSYVGVRTPLQYM